MTEMRASEMPTGDALGIVPHGSVEGMGMFLRAGWVIGDKYGLDGPTIRGLAKAVGSATAALSLLDDGHAVEYILALGPWTGLPSDGHLPLIAAASPDASSQAESVVGLSSE